MSINLTKRKYLLYLTLITLLLSGVGGVTYFSLVPEHYFGGYPLIPVFFYIFGVFNIYMFDACRRISRIASSFSIWICFFTSSSSFWAAASACLRAS